jgi:hypothetical protein
MPCKKLEFVLLHGTGFWEKENLPDRAVGSQIVISDNIPSNTQKFLVKHLQGNHVPHHVISDQGAFIKHFKIP